jgi:hypothetical protein
MATLQNGDKYKEISRTRQFNKESGAKADEMTKRG